MQHGVDAQDREALLAPVVQHHLGQCVGDPVADGAPGVAAGAVAVDHQGPALRGHLADRQGEGELDLLASGADRRALAEVDGASVGGGLEGWGAELELRQDHQPLDLLRDQGLAQAVALGGLGGGEGTAVLDAQVQVRELGRVEGLDGGPQALVEALGVAHREDRRHGQVDGTLLRPLAKRGVGLPGWTERTGRRGRGHHRGEVLVLGEGLAL